MTYSSLIWAVLGLLVHVSSVYARPSESESEEYVKFEYDSENSVALAVTIYGESGFSLFLDLLDKNTAEKIRTLILVDCRIKKEIDMKAVPELTNLKVLQLHDCMIQAESVGALTQGALSKLVVMRTSVASEVVCQWIRKSECLQDVHFDELEGAAGILKCLAEDSELKHLAYVNSGLTDESLRQIGKMEDLRSLYIGDNSFSKNGLSHIALGKLTTLSIRGTLVGDKAIPILSGMKHLKGLDVSDTGISAEGFSKLGKALGTKILADHLE